MKSSFIDLENSSSNQYPQNQQVQETRKQPEIGNQPTFQTIGQQQQFTPRQVQLPNLLSYMPTYEAPQTYTSYIPYQQYSYPPQNQFKYPFQSQQQFIPNILAPIPAQYPPYPFVFVQQQYPQQKELIYMNQIGHLNQMALQATQQPKQSQVFQNQKAIYEQQMKQQHLQFKNQQPDSVKLNEKKKQEQNEQKEIQCNQQVSLQKSFKKEEEEIQSSGKKQKIQIQEDQMVQINKTKVTINLKKLNELKFEKNPIKEDISAISINGVESKSSDQIKQVSTYNESSKSMEKRRRVNNYAVNNFKIIFNQKDYNFVHLISQPRGKKNSINGLKPHRIEKKITHIRTHGVNFRKVSTRQTKCQNNELEYFEFVPFNCIKNEGFSRIGEQYQVDIDKAINDEFDLETMKKKLQMQKVWNGQKNQNIYNDIYEKVKEQVYQGVTHQDILTIIHSFNNNIQLLHKKLLEKDSVVVHDILELRLSFKKQDVLKQKILQAE